MAASLPLELLCEIAGHLQHAGASLVACTTVCRRWKAAFEPIIYSELNVYSEDGHDGRGICLEQFQALTSGAGIARRAWVRQLRYHIVVPFELPDWTAREKQWYGTNTVRRYSTDNVVRRANDTAFQSAVISLFNALNAWDKNHRLSVILALQGRRRGQEPSTEEDDDAGRLTWYTHAVPVYRARFLDNGASMLCDVSCIHKMSLPHLIWAGAAMQIVRRCPKLAELRLDQDDYIRPDHLEYMKQRRQAVSDGLKDMPPTLRVFHFENGDERNWLENMPALNVLNSDTDFLSIRIRDLSLSLRELKLVQAPVSLDFLWPLDRRGRSLPGNTSLYWPYLETLTLSQFRPWLPSGKWIVRPTPENEAIIAEIVDWKRYICDHEEGFVERLIFEQEQFHRLFISLGYAARHMPRLRAINFDLNHYLYLNFRFSNGAGSISVEWEMERHGSYTPDQRVAAAWGFQLDHRQIPGWDYRATLSQWPPVEGSLYDFDDSTLALPNDSHLGAFLGTVLSARCTVVSEPAL